jgi:hypothetical protein
MGLAHSPAIITDGLIAAFDASNSRSWRGEITTNLIGSTPLSLTLYAYASGPVAIANELDHTFTRRTVNRYTITSAVNAARASIRPTGLLTNTNYTFSCIWRYNGSNANVSTLAVSASKGSPEINGSNTFNSETKTDTAIGNGWYKTVYTFNFATSPTNATILTYGISTGTTAAYVNNTFDVYNEQFEERNYASPYVAVSRGRNTSTGGGFTNLVADAHHGIVHGEVQTGCSNQGVTVLDGVNDYLGFSSSTKAYHWTPSGVGNNNLSIELWARITDNSGYIFSRPWNGSGNYNYYVHAGGVVIRVADEFVINFAQSVPLNVWRQLVLTLSPTTVAVYLNGVAIAGPSAHSLTNNTPTDGDANLALTIMSLYPYSLNQETPWAGNTNFSIGGNVSQLRVYNRTLSATEIKKNFDANRGRYAL